MIPFFEFFDIKFPYQEEEILIIRTLVVWKCPWEGFISSPAIIKGYLSIDAIAQIDTMGEILGGNQDESAFIYVARVNIDGTFHGILF